MTPRVRRAAFVAILVAAVGATWLGWNALHEAAPSAPDFTLVDTGYENGTRRAPQTFNLSDFRGKTVVLDFMAYNCAACRVVTPNVMDPLYAEYGRREDFELLTIDVGEFSNFPGSTHANLVKWQTEEYGSPWRHALDDKGVFLDYLQLGALGLPAVFIVDPEGSIIYEGTGIPDLDELRGIIDGSIAGEGEPAQVLTIGIVGLAFVAGVASFMAPCSIALIPAYLGFLINQKGSGRRIILTAGVPTTLGIVTLYAVLGLVMWLARDALAGVVPWLGPFVGGAFILLGGLMLLGFDWDRVAVRMGLGRFDGRRGFFTFGVGYGLAAFACTGPILVPVLIAAFAQGVAVALAAFVAYTAAVASLVLAAAYLVHAGKQGALRRLLSNAVVVTRVSAVLLILAGAYLVWFDVTAFAP